MDFFQSENIQGLGNNGVLVKIWFGVSLLDL